MFLVAAGTTQALLVSDLLLRRLLILCMPSKRHPVQRLADNSAISSFASLVLQMATVPLQGFGSIVSIVTRFWVLLIVAFCCFAGLMILSSSSVHAYIVFAQMYNVGIAPVVTASRWLFVLLDFVFRGVVPLWNGLTYISTELLRGVVLPYSFHNVETLPELLQGLTLAVTSFGTSLQTWLMNILECTLQHKSTLRVCGQILRLANSTGTEVRTDCTAMFTPIFSQCFASPTYLTIDLLTPGLFARQAMLALRRVIADHCGVAALVLNLVLFPLAEHDLYAAVHAMVNAGLFLVIGLPITTLRRCEAAKLERGGPSSLPSKVHELISCTPDWQPLALMATSGLESLGRVGDSWLNAIAIMARDRIGESNVDTNRCDTSVRMGSIVLDAARAIEGLESVEALERLAGRHGLPDSETLLRVRVVGLTPRLFGVTDGKAVLYRGAHDGYVWAYGAWPFPIDVQLGLAAVSYSGSSTETDSTGDSRTGLLGCKCVDTANSFLLLCATAPYVQHLDDDAEGLNQSAVHTVSFPELSIAGMSCGNIAVRVLPLRWPRRRLATPEGGGGSGYGKYQRFSHKNVAGRFTGDTDAIDNLRLLSSRYRSTTAGAVEAALFVQPKCGDGSALACILAAENCFPWCMGVIRGGVRAQNVTMYNTRSWESHIFLPDVDCGVRRDNSEVQSENCKGERLTNIVDITTQAGIVRGRCAAERMCTPSPISGLVSSLVPLAALDTGDGPNTTELGLAKQHKKNWLNVRLEEQPFVIAGDVLLNIHRKQNVSEVVVTRLYDIGHGSLQMSSERLTLTSNMHTIEIQKCENAADTDCVAGAMAAGKIVLPSAFTLVAPGSQSGTYSDGGEVSGILPAAASRWAVHWAVNPELNVYTALFDFCNGRAGFSLIVASSFGRARVWTAHTMRAVDLEQNGEPTDEDIKSRVSYMRVPDFFADFFTTSAHADTDQKVQNLKNYCKVVVGLKVVGVEYINAQNVLITVLAARPQDYDARSETVSGPRIYRYYFLHPGRHDCYETDEEEVAGSSRTGDDRIFSCWRTHDSGMWPDDSVLSGGMGRGREVGAWDSQDLGCVESQIVPAFGSSLIMPLIGVVGFMELILDALCTMTALVVANPKNPSLAMYDLTSVPLHRTTYHSMADSGGARLFYIENIIAASSWSARFNAHLLIYCMNALTSATSSVLDNKFVDKNFASVRTTVIGIAKVVEGSPTGIPQFHVVERLFENPIAFSSSHASIAVLTMADGLQGGLRMPVIITGFVRVQASMVGTFALILRLVRVTTLRLLEVGEKGASATATTALLESRSIIHNEMLNVMRFQCYGLSQIVGATRPWGHALQNMCLLLPDTLEGVLTVFIVLVIDYPTVDCACKLSDGDVDKGTTSVLNVITEVCLLRPLPIEETQWLTALTVSENDRRGICFATMDRANALFHTAFDKAYSRLYKMTEHAAGVGDGLLSLITGDSVACDAFDVSPYVFSIIPEPVDYFSSCVDTADCRIRCLEEYDAFDAAKQEQLALGVKLGFSTTIAVNIESMLFSSEDIENGKNLPPFMIQDIAELPRSACLSVCAGAASNYAQQRNRCVLVAGLRVNTVLGERQEIGIAYYCLPMDIRQYVFQWPGMESATQPSPGQEGAFPPVSGIVVSLHIATLWAATEKKRDMIIAVVHSADASFAASPDLIDEGVTEVLLFAPNIPVPLQILRTSNKGERQLDVDIELPERAGFLHKIDMVQVEMAQRSSDTFALQVRGYIMKRERIGTSELFMWSLPQKACVKCEVTLSQDAPAVDCSFLCVDENGNDESREDDAQEERDRHFDFARAHSRICLAQHVTSEEAETSRVSKLCYNTIALPRSMRDTSEGTTTSGTMHLRMLIGDKYVTKAMSVPANIISMLHVDGIQRAYRDMQKQPQARVAIMSRVYYVSEQDMVDLRTLVTVSETSADTNPAVTDLGVDVEIIVANAKNEHGDWLHILEMFLTGAQASGALRNGMRAEEEAFVHMDCSVHHCGACAQSSSGSFAPERAQLENTCYAAMQCGIERCAGTLVNMRKPLCNLGKVLTSELHSVRVLLQAVWHIIADKVAMTVELTHSRRESYELKWPSKSLRQTTCTAKDSIVSMAATFTSVLGAVSHLMQDVALYTPHAGAHVDARVHARYVMVLAATTNLLSSVMLFPVYQMIVVEKFISCTSTDVSYTIMNIMNSAGGKKQPQILINFGDGMTDASAKAGVATCLTEDVRQSLQDAGMRIQALSTKSDQKSQLSRKKIDSAGGTNKILRLVADAISSSIDTALRSYVQFFYHVYDIMFTWAKGIIKGMMDIAQTVDWERCKLPVVDNGMRSLGQCACGDEAYSIPASQKATSWTNKAFWCSGLIMLNAGDGSDTLVWNPFSLEQLLNMQGARQADTKNKLVLSILESMPDPHTDYERFIKCMQIANSDCEYFKPRETRLSQQGIDVMQVIGRCRTNYQQVRWDEAAVLYALFTIEEWRSASTLQSSASARKDDEFSLLRKQIIKLTTHDKRFWTQAERGLYIDIDTWACLDDALSVGMLRHNCHRRVSTYEYVAVKSNSLAEIDACRVPPSSTTLRFPRMLWSGSSTNHVPIAKLHPVQVDTETRVNNTIVKIQTMILEEIKPMFEELLAESFSESLKSHLEVSAFSVEGDMLHQLVDCVVMGPFASAELSPNLHLPGTASLPVPLYHRGDPESRAFTSYGETGGSEARKTFIRAVQHHVNEKAEGILTGVILDHVKELAISWLNIDNFLCQCAKGPPTVFCCIGIARQDISFRVSLQDSWSLDNKVNEDAIKSIIDGKILDKIWLDQIGKPVLLDEAQSSVAEQAHFFKASGVKPVRTYTAEDSVSILNNESLWEWCTSRVAGLYTTIPLTDKKTNENERRASNRSIPHVAPEDYEYDPAHSFDGAPTRDHDKARRHSMELLVDNILRQAHLHTPHFWTRAHRYVASDSVWCETDSEHVDLPLHEKQTAYTSNMSAHLDENHNKRWLRTENIKAPDQNHVVYPSDVLRVCACGWRHDQMCTLSNEICTAGTMLLNLEVLPDVTLQWNTICQERSYKSKKELLVVLFVLEKLVSRNESTLRSCNSRDLSTTWGLLTPHQYEAWYTGESGGVQYHKQWHVGTQHLASAGPGGLRIGMLSSENEEDAMQNYVRNFELGEKFSDVVNTKYEHTIGQPTCHSTSSKLLRDELNEYFVDTLIPMAHSVQIVPSVEYCTRWIIEYAMLLVLKKVHKDLFDKDPHNLANARTPPHDKKSRIELLILQQQEIANKWHSLCSVQIVGIGICKLRGIYDIIPAGDLQVHQHCPPVGTISNCGKKYFTSGCLIFCDEEYYDPCLCENQIKGSSCAAKPFSPGVCQKGIIRAGHKILGEDHDFEGILTASLHWPHDILPGEVHDKNEWVKVTTQARKLRVFSKNAHVDTNMVFFSTLRLLKNHDDTEDEPETYCDDLLDYWPDVQHPLGYHPTTACTDLETHTRGFAAWMSRDKKGHALIDPTRMRNTTLASQFFGSAHLVCDVNVYVAPGHGLNPYYMISKWKQDAQADPAVPIKAHPILVKDMEFEGTPSMDPTDTAFRAKVDTYDPLPSHSVGIIRSWADWAVPFDPQFKITQFERQQKKQNELNKLWPHWSIDFEGEPLSGLFLASKGPSAPRGCVFPTLKYCYSDEQCKSNSKDQSLKCLMSTVSQRGICMKEDTCFEHSHCLTAKKLCSGEGICVLPQVRVRNEANISAEVQFFASSGCDVSMQRLSLFEGIPDFAQANGLCSFRNWFHFLNTTENTSPFKNIHEIQDHMLHYTDRSTPATLSDLKVLQPVAHACDRSYMHTDYDVCNIPGKLNGFNDARFVSVSQTWRQKTENADKEWYARFCDMRPTSISGFLNPYAPNSETLHSAAQDIRRCAEYDLCPLIHFHVKGRTVENRRVIPYEANTDSVYGVETSQDITFREYCSLDAQRCGGVGYLLGRDCAAVDREEFSDCIVDTLVLPLVPFVFTTISTDGTQELSALRMHCPNAFTLSFRGKNDLELFNSVKLHLTRPYRWIDAEQHDLVNHYANALLWFVFGMTDEKSITGDGRGFTDIEGYLVHSQCTVYLAHALRRNEERVKNTGNGANLYANSWRTFVFTSTTSADTPAVPVMPGSSLYLFSGKVPVAISLRWFLQCVVLAKNTAEGGVDARFLKNVYTVGAFEVIECENYVDGIKNFAVNGVANPDVSIELRKWLRTAPFLFTQMDSDNVNMHALQINRDVMATMSFAIEQLPVFEIPDLVCVSAETGFGVLAATDTINYRHHELRRFSAHNIDLSNKRDIERMLENSDNVNIYQQVLDFLSPGAYKWTLQSPTTVKNLMDNNVIRERQEDLRQMVLPTEVYPRYEYVQLREENIATWYSQNVGSKRFSEDQYVQDSNPACRCGTNTALPCKKLKRQEYKMTSPMRCRDSKVLECTSEVVALLDARTKHTPPFLLQEELLYLVLLIFDLQIKMTVSGGFMALHKIRDSADVQAMSDIFAQELPRQLERLSFLEANQFNEFVESRKLINFKCPPKNINYQQETNQHHTNLRQCKESLQEQIGWSIPRRAGGITNKLDLAPPVESMLSGFYPAFLLRDRDKEDKTFLDTLVDTSWYLSEFAAYERAVCVKQDNEFSVIAPFWAEFFDVATNVAGEDSADDPPLGCDMQRSGRDNKLMIYNTLCAATATTTRSCEAHPSYDYHLHNTLSSTCAQKHGHAVMRSRLGSLRDTFSPLCSLRPTTPTTCPHVHGTLHGHTGETMEDLYTKMSISKVETGFWKKTNSIFRGVQSELATQNVPAIALSPQDIGGHCLDFTISPQGWLYLHRAPLTTECEEEGSEVRSWLQNIEQSWAWDNAHAEKLLATDSTETVSWHCPLHWLQQFHDDGGEHQTRAPSWRRNKLRFEHITGEYAYAHPTVRNTYKLRGISAARFMSDTMACVAQNETQCHDDSYLSETISTLLSSQTKWHEVQYVPVSEQECPRLLDWPHDCGHIEDGSTSEGACNMRH